MSLVLFIMGAVALVVGAEVLVRGASRLAKAVGIDPLIIGLTVVSLSTSTPEIAISIGAALQGHGDMALGNVVGSNIFNVLVILGLSSLVAPLLVVQRLLWWDVPLMIGFAGLMLMLGVDGHLGRLDGLILCVCLVVYLWWAIRLSRRDSSNMEDACAGAYPDHRQRNVHHIAIQFALILSGLGLLVLGADWFVQGAVRIAHTLGISELVVSLTIVSAGTSLPEVAVSVLAAARGARDIAVGNVIGSNIFNVLAVLGISAMVLPVGLSVPLAALYFDIPVMIATFVACLPIFFTGHVISRWEGAMFLGYYVAYVAYLVLETTAHDALPVFSQMMLLFVLPLTAITLVIGVARAYRESQPRSVPGEEINTG